MPAYYGLPGFDFPQLSYVDSRKRLVKSGIAWTSG